MTQFEAFKEACKLFGHSPEEIEKRIAALDKFGFPFPGREEEVKPGEEESTIQTHYQMLKMAEEFLDTGKPGNN